MELINRMEPELQEAVQALVMKSLSTDENIQGALREFKEMRSSVMAKENQRREAQARELHARVGTEKLAPFVQQIESLAKTPGFQDKTYSEIYEIVSGDRLNRSVKKKSNPSSPRTRGSKRTTASTTPVFKDINDAAEYAWKKINGS